MRLAARTPHPFRATTGATTLPSASITRRVANARAFWAGSTSGCSTSRTATRIWRSWDPASRPCGQPNSALRLPWTTREREPRSSPLATAAQRGDQPESFARPNDKRQPIGREYAAGQRPPSGGSTPRASAPDRSFGGTPPAALGGRTHLGHHLEGRRRRSGGLLRRRNVAISASLSAGSAR